MGKMNFIWSDSGDTNFAEKEMWKYLNLAIDDECGVCYHRYPLISADRSRREPDILILHPEWGLYVINCKDYKIDEIAKVNGSTWIFDDDAQDNPADQAEDQLWFVLGKFKQESDLRDGRKDIIQGHVFIALPFISRSQWNEKGFESSDSTSTMIFSDDLDPKRLKKRLQDFPEDEKQTPLTDFQFSLAQGVLHGAPVLRRTLRPLPANPNSKAALLRKVEQQMISIDREQSKVAIQIPNGPQRIRGLSGSGKTVVMCMKAAWMHLRFPDWDIVYTFYTRSLYGMIRSLITRFYRYWVDQDPDWNKIHVLHGWGGKETPGFYSTVALEMKKPPLSYYQARSLFSFSKQNQLLGNCCNSLLKSGEKIPENYDAILIDEGQDFHYNFYQLCYRTLRNPKRLIWAYDEVQSLESLEIPTAIDIFGTDPEGNPIVSLEGTYQNGEVEKDLILYRCYRTPRPVLVAAHFFGMGLLRSKGAVQFIPKLGGWEDIGYEIVNGSFLVGSQVTIRRPEENSPHLLEKLVGYKDLIQCYVFQDRNQEIAWISEQIWKNINEDELNPREIMVILLDWKRSKIDIPALKQSLHEKKINAIRPGHDTNSDVFQMKNNVTITNIFPAKGNEASVVYVMGFEQVGTDEKMIVQQRNQAFTAMTRTRGWCVLTGIGSKALSLFKEIELILQNPKGITFKVPDPTVIQRNLDSLEYERRRNRVKKANKLVDELKRLLAEIDDQESRRRIIQRLQK